MFEIGPALREARERQQLSYSQVEEGTKIRSRYIRALEEEDFSVLPGPTYTKGFLRAYADFLGLDGHLFIDEFNSRHHDPRAEPEQREIYPQNRARQQHRRRRESGIVMIALAAIVLIVSLVFIAAKSSNDTAQLPLPPATNPGAGSTGASSDAGGTSDGSSAGTSTKPTTHAKRHQTARPKKMTIVISATGDCYVTTHVGSMSGPPAVTEKGTTLDNYLLQPGVEATIKSGKPVYVAFGAPGNISGITINGKAVQVPYVGSAQSMKITADGISAA
jgi:cytoskeletal protein RodZ